MISIQLWRALNHPPAMHPLFWLTSRRAVASSALNHIPGRLGWIDRLSIAYLLVFAAVMLLANALGTNAQPGLVTLLMFLLTLPVIVPIAILLRSTLLSGCIYGLIWTMNISQYVVHERQNHTYDLLCLLPPGGLAADWAICTGCLYQGQAFNRILELRGVMSRIIFMLSAIVLLGSMIGRLSVPEALILGIDVVTLLVALHIDFGHSVILSGLIGMIAPLYSHSQTDARIWAAGGFLTLQLSAYAITLFTGLAAAPRILERMGIEGWPAAAIIPICTVLVLTVIREGYIAWLWRWLVTRTNTDPHDLGRVFTFRP